MKTPSTPMPERSFSSTICQAGVSLERRTVDTVQVNLGKRCNQACSHCHVGAGPTRTEMMSTPDVDRLLALLARSEIQRVDLTGGAPELHPEFRRIVRECRRSGLDVIDRCNLTILTEPGQEQTAAFLRDHQVRVVASLPCYTRDNVDTQRGRGVFSRSTEALRVLNALGYGAPDSGLILDLVYNPGGPFLPAPQAALESDYRTQLRKEHDIRFSNLLTLTNMPIARFRQRLVREGQLDDYLALLIDSFNPGAAEAVMCRSLVSVSWDGRLYDCDFNQMLDIPAANHRRTIWDVDNLAELEAEPIACADHCFGCTAGAGSSCGGTLVDVASDCGPHGQ